MDVFLRHLDRITEVIDEHAELRHLLGIGIFMGTVYKRQLLPEVILGYRLVGDQHEILDQPGCVIALVSLDLDGFVLFIDNDLALREIKVDRAALHASFTEQIRELVHQEQIVLEIRVFGHILA